jgi:hypothetical protein
MGGSRPARRRPRAAHLDRPQRTARPRLASPRADHPELEVYLAVRDAAATDWQELGGSASTSVPGSYRVIAVADALGQHTEVDEANNAAMSEPVAMAPYQPDSPTSR